eukprot:gnl/MRDRNA2_/MRDRNA2_100293_c0_seq1.p1 gnl/MRDRNA2_/MRDRNA2_100293_c0~~gnl/MRDRNA2_/MRDRNA2_100293_c0_seq1.p1  ORF type:complete len:305 (+),score=38.08 gnl/MRDRNA2_/MRDRNA2_100293_c0_seq1:87-1001(+)
MAMQSPRQNGFHFNAVTQAIQAATNANTGLDEQNMRTGRKDPHILMLMEMLQTSSILRSVIPSVRQMALFESLRMCSTFEAAKQLVIENMAGSPYIPDELKNKLVDLVLLEQWEELQEILQCQRAAHMSTPTDFQRHALPTNFQMFRAMVVQMFSRSRKIKALPEARRFQLGSTMHSITTIEGLKEFAFHSLEQARTLTAQDRQRIANDLLDNRYDLLLLPDRFDCDEKPRQRPEAQPGRQQGAEADDDECPICLGTNVVDRELQCGHRICGCCLDQWVSRSGGSQFSCPMCRTPCSRSQVRDA